MAASSALPLSPDSPLYSDIADLECCIESVPFKDHIDKYTPAKPWVLAAITQAGASSARDASRTHYIPAKALNEHFKMNGFRHPMGAEIAIDKIHYFAIRVIPEGFKHITSCSKLEEHEFIQRYMQASYEEELSDRLLKIRKELIASYKANPNLDRKELLFWLELTHKEFPRDLAIMKELGILLQSGQAGVRDCVQAEKCLRAVVNADGDPFATLHLGMLLYTGGPGVSKNFPEARKYLEIAHTAFPDNPHVNAYLGSLLFEGSATFPRDLVRAKKHLKAALAVDKNDLHANIFYAAFLLEKCPPTGISKHEKTLERAGKLINRGLSQLHTVHKELELPLILWGMSLSAEIYRKRGQFVVASAFFQEVLERDLLHYYALSRLGACNVASGDNSTAKEQLKRATELASFQAFAFAELGALFLRGDEGITKDDKAMARDLLSIAESIDPYNEHVLSSKVPPPPPPSLPSSSSASIHRDSTVPGNQIPKRPRATFCDDFCIIL